MSGGNMSSEIERRITIKDFDNKRWPEGYIGEERKYCAKETKKFLEAADALEEARQEVLNKRMEFYGLWWLEKEWRVK